MLIIPGAQRPRIRPLRDPSIFLRDLLPGARLRCHWVLAEITGEWPGKIPDTLF